MIVVKSGLIVIKSLIIFPGWVGIGTISAGFKPVQSISEKNNNIGINPVQLFIYKELKFKCSEKKTNFIKAVIRNIGPGQFGGMKGFFAF